jgi:hypothetical protein
MDMAFSKQLSLTVRDAQRDMTVSLSLAFVPALLSVASLFLGH